MTKINLSRLNLTEKELRVAKGIIATRGKNKGCLRASKPKTSRDNIESGLTAYVWRMVAFYVSENSQHQCMPVTCQFDLPGRMFSEEYKEAEAWCNELVDKILETIPKSEWHGINRWSQALGYR